MRAPLSRTVATPLLAGLVLLVSVACSSAEGRTDVVVSEAGAELIHVAPAGTGPVVAGVDVVVAVERRALVTDVAVVEGAPVTAGQPLLSVFTVGDSNAVADATTDLRAVEQELQGVRARDGIGAASTLDLVARVAAARQRLADLKSAPTVLVAPVDGRVSALAVAAGQEITRTDEAMHVVDDRELRVTVSVAAAYQQLVGVGQPAKITVPGGSGETFDATVLSVGAQALDDSTETATVPITVSLPRPAAGLTAGVQAYVRFEIDRVAPVAVDALAVLGAGQEPFVFVLEDNQVEQRAVQTGPSDGRVTEITQGLSAGDQVVISGGQRLLTGDRVAAVRSDRR